MYYINECKYRTYFEKSNSHSNYLKIISVNGAILRVKVRFTIPDGFSGLIQ